MVSGDSLDSFATVSLRTLPPSRQDHGCSKIMKVG